MTTIIDLWTSQIELLPQALHIHSLLGDGTVNCVNPNRSKASRPELDALANNKHCQLSD